MARARFVRPEFFTDEKVGELPYGARLLFESIWCQSDLRGVFEYSAKSLRVVTFPFDEGLTSVTVQEWLDALESRKMIARFESREKVWGYVCKWKQYQSISGREVEIDKKLKPEQRRPEPPCGAQAQPGDDPDRTHAPSPSPSPSSSPSPAVGGTVVPGNSPTLPALEDVKARNREALAKELRRQGIPAAQEAIQEWADLLTGVGGCKDLADALLAFRWIMKQPTPTAITYAKHARPLAIRWKAEVVDRSEP